MGLRVLTWHDLRDWPEAEVGTEHQSGDTPPIPPLILTLTLAPPDQARFEALRQAHFPQARNLVQAHVTLFHALPGADEPAIRHALALVSAARIAFDVQVSGLRSLGRGVAYELHSEALARLRKGLAVAWHGGLSTQDRQGYRPHITVQNKVAPDEARTLLEHLRAGFSPFAVRAVGLALWRYRGGPWEPVEGWEFAAGGAVPGEAPGMEHGSQHDAAKAIG